ncbi:uncharacterized protein LOC143260480 [Megalopta genalis]|uniref:uncharacterized protein LOC143260480 n=1 Tax=Megalopta genalis TaxID=115081 RepID=UPI003FCEEFC8
MYRQILVREKDRHYQRILWRFSEDEPISEYCLNTVGKDCAQLLPRTSETILRDFYVDDLLTGCKTFKQALELQNSLISALAKAGFPLRKWASNDPRLTDQPHDQLSRGSSPSTLRNSNLWWYGPQWLSANALEWPSNGPDSLTIEVPEARPTQIIQLTTPVNRDHVIMDLLDKYSCYSKLLRIIAYILRFCLGELLSAERVVIRFVQEQHFGQEINTLRAGNPLEGSNSILSLNPFLDDHGIVRAIHLELSTDLTTDSFLNCFRRFISHRGKCRVIYSDNGTNFIGARNELKDLGELLASRAHNEKCETTLAQDHIQWQLILPRAPYFGGLWERGVRSVKTHLRRVIGEQRLTFVEMCMILAQIEACLNSRPLHPLSSDPSDLNPLTPGHFLVGESLTTLPHADLTDIRQNRLNRFQLLQQTIQHFWRRWQRDYLHNLQQRHKWKQGHGNPLKVGDMVLIKEENLPPLKWALGRLVELHLGQDGICRVFTIRTTRGMLKRPASKICMLPIEED